MSLTWKRHASQSRTTAIFHLQVAFQLDDDNTIETEQKIFVPLTIDFGDGFLEDMVIPLEVCQSVFWCMLDFLSYYTHSGLTDMLFLFFLSFLYQVINLINMLLVCMAVILSSSHYFSDLAVTESISTVIVVEFMSL